MKLKSNSALSQIEAYIEKGFSNLSNQKQNHWKNFNCRRRI